MATGLNVLERRFEGPLAHRLTAAASSMGITLYWHGQAGFVIQAGARRLICCTDAGSARAAGTPLILVDFGYTEIPAAEVAPDIPLYHFDELVEACARCSITDAAEKKHQGTSG